MNTKHTAALALTLFGAMASLPAHAGRPLSTDDAGTAEQGCQVEAWTEHAKGEDAYVVAPACAVGPGLEIDADYTRYRLVGGSASEFGLALKWAPAAGEVDTPLGKLRLGAKVGFGGASGDGAGWRTTGVGALVLSMLELTPHWSLHLNAGPQYDREAKASSTLVNLAATWTPSDRTLLFVEWLASDRRQLNGGTVRSAGARWWVSQDVFALDVTASRVAGSNTTVWGIGFGWYGLGIK
jgi:hypothetical protein